MLLFFLLDICRCANTVCEYAVVGMVRLGSLAKEAIIMSAGI